MRHLVTATVLAVTALAGGACAEPATTAATPPERTTATTNAPATSAAPATTTTVEPPPLPPAPPPVPPAPPQPPEPPSPEPACDPNYSGCVPVDSDVDCAGGSGNGPSYVRGPIRVTGSDIYKLDHDGDGIACE